MAQTHTAPLSMPLPGKRGRGRLQTLAQRLRDLSITFKLAAIVLAFVVGILALVGVVALCLDIASGVRAYVGGEGLWSKGQKDAVYYLSRYARSGDPADYGKYTAAIAIPLGDRKARLELEKPEYDYAIVERGFVEGGNAPEDVPELILVFRYFGNVSYLAKGIDIWRRAEVHVLELVQCAEELRAAMKAGTLDETRRHELTERIELINAQLTPLEGGFSATLGEGARWLSGVLLAVILGAAALFLASGLAVSWAIARQMRSRLRRLRQGALLVAQGHLEHRILVRSRDELGDLATVFNDMIARRGAAEDALRSANEFRDKVMQSASNAIQALDVNGRFTLVNSRACEITGYDEHELLGSHYEMVIAPEARAAVAETFKSAALDGRSNFDVEAPIMRKDGRLRIVRFSNAPLMRDRMIVGVVSTAEDVTERKAAEAELAARAEALARSNKELEQFAFAASHDLQEPVRTVAIYTQLLARRVRNGGGESLDDLVGFVTDAVQRMRDLIDGLLTYSRMARQDEDLAPAPLDLLLDTALANLQSAIDDSGARILREPLPTLKVSAPLIAQLFQNLIGNALKFRSERTPEVRISAERQGARWLLSIRDNGIGIDPKYAERIFVLFQRLHTRDEVPGSGLGLAICKRITERHHGDIWLDPCEDGALFRVALPAAD